VSTSTAISGCFQPDQAKVVLGPTPTSLVGKVTYVQNRSQIIAINVLLYMRTSLINFDLLGGKTEIH
jgi:hypothetical protein